MDVYGIGHGSADKAEGRREDSKEGGGGLWVVLPPIARVAAAADKLLLSTPCGTPSYYATPACGKHPLPLRCSVSLVSCFGQIYKLRLAWNTNCMDRGSVHVYGRECVYVWVWVCVSECECTSEWVCECVYLWRCRKVKRLWKRPAVAASVLQRRCCCPLFPLFPIFSSTSSALATLPPPPLSPSPMPLETTFLC